MEHHDLSYLLTDVINKKVIETVVDKFAAEHDLGRERADILAALWHKNLNLLKGRSSDERIQDTIETASGLTAQPICAASGSTETPKAARRLLERVSPLPLCKVQNCNGAPPRHMKRPIDPNTTTRASFSAYLKRKPATITADIELRVNSNKKIRLEPKYEYKLRSTPRYPPFCGCKVEIEHAATTEVTSIAGDRFITCRVSLVYENGTVKVRSNLGDEYLVPWTDASEVPRPGPDGCQTKTADDNDMDDIPIEMLTEELFSDPIYAAAQNKITAARITDLLFSSDEDSEDEAVTSSRAVSDVRSVKPSDIESLLSSCGLFNDPSITSSLPRIPLSDGSKSDQPQQQLKVPQSQVDDEALLHAVEEAEQYFRLLETRGVRVQVITPSEKTTFSEVAETADAPSAETPVDMCIVGDCVKFVRNATQKCFKITLKNVYVRYAGKERVFSTCVLLVNNSMFDMSR